MKGKKLGLTSKIPFITYITKNYSPPCILLDDLSNPILPQLAVPLIHLVVPLLLALLTLAAVCLHLIVEVLKKSESLKQKYHFFTSAICSNIYFYELTSGGNVSNLLLLAAVSNGGVLVALLLVLLLTVGDGLLSDAAGVLILLLSLLNKHGGPAGPGG